VKKDTVQTNVSLPAPAAVKPPNYMVFSCSLDRADKAVRAAKDPARLARFQALRTDALAAYKAKDYGRAVELHDAAHRAAKGEDAPPRHRPPQRPRLWSPPPPVRPARPRPPS
jgi:hypothetical protein